MTATIKKRTGPSVRSGWIQHRIDLNMLLGWSEEQRGDCSLVNDELQAA
jgi:hypothetical protein